MSVGVLFGGPTPEHDISILTGLLALARTRAIRRRRRRASTGPRPARSTACRAASRPKRSSTVCPRARVNSACDSATRAVSSSSARMGKDRAARPRRRGPRHARRTGRGRHRCRPRSTSPASRYSGPSVAGAALGMDKWSFGAVMARRGPPDAAARAARRLDDLAAIRRSVHLEAAIRRFLDRHRRGGRLRDRARRDSRRIRTSRSVASWSPTAPTSRTFRSPCGPIPRSPSRRSSVRFAAAIDAEILDYRDKYVGGEGMVSAPRELPGRDARRSGRRRAALHDARSPRWRRCAAWRASTFSRATTNSS